MGIDMSFNYLITEFTGYGRVVHGNGFDSVEDAKDYVEQRFGKIMCFEEDEEHRHHYDMLTKYSRILSIEPYRDETKAWYDTSLELM